VDDVVRAVGSDGRVGVGFWRREPPAGRPPPGVRLRGRRPGGGRGVLAAGGGRERVPEGPVRAPRGLAGGRRVQGPARRQGARHGLRPGGQREADTAGHRRGEEGGAGGARGEGRVRRRAGRARRVRAHGLGRVQGARLPGGYSTGCTSGRFSSMAVTSSSMSRSLGRSGSWSTPVGKQLHEWLEGICRPWLSRFFHFRS
jgi:hypothetical protein